MKKVELRDMTGMGSATLAKMGKNEQVSMDVIKRICEILECDIGDVMEMIPEENEKNSYGWHIMSCRDGKMNR